MKKLVLTATIIVLTVFGAIAQKYAYIDSEYLLNNIPSYLEAQAELDKLSVEWQKEIEAKFKKIDEMYKKYQQDVVVLPEETKQKRQQEIIDAEKEAKELQKKRFGTDGDLFKKREELVKPIQDRVFTAIEEYAREKNYAFIFDKAGDLTIVYADAMVSKGVVSLQNDRSTSYAMYVAVQNQLTLAFNELREEYAQQRFGKSYERLSESEKKGVQKVYPISISEAEPSNYGGRR
jgi:outer membrane protein